jgi:DUF4097 and DUF4098 domain-containing protein YvlB
MTTWTLDHPDKLTFDEVRRVQVKTVEGSVSVVGSDDRPTLELSELSGEPLRVEFEDGTLTVGYEPWRPWPLAWLVGLRGPVDVQSVSGPVQASGVTGDLSAHTVSGDLTVAEGGGGSVRAKTVSGAVTIDLQASGDRDINLTSVSGDLTVRLPDTSDLQVKLQSTSGQVSSAFDQLERDRTPGRYTAWGRLGAGTGRLRAASTSGHVALLRRAPEATV